jgi:hypothetical protein
MTLIFHAKESLFYVKIIRRGSFFFTTSAPTPCKLTVLHNNFVLHNSVFVSLVRQFFTVFMKSSSFFSNGRRCVVYSIRLRDIVFLSYQQKTDYLQFFVPLKNFSLLLRRHHYQWKAEIFRRMIGAQSLWTGRNIYHATHAVTRGLGFPVSSEGSPHSVASYDTQEDVGDLF